VSRTTVLLLRQRLQANGYATRQTTPLPDSVTETDEMFPNAGKKSEPHQQPHPQAAPSTPTGCA
jgi:hypothetical protein